jgi:hypothetical protein
MGWSRRAAGRTRLPFAGALLIILHRRVRQTVDWLPLEIRALITSSCLMEHQANKRRDRRPVEKRLIFKMLRTVLHKNVELEEPSDSRCDSGCKGAFLSTISPSLLHRAPISGSRRDIQYTLFRCKRREAEMSPGARGEGQRKTAAAQSGGAAPRGTAKRRNDGAQPMTDAEILATVCGYFCDRPHRSRDRRMKGITASDSRSPTVCGASAAGSLRSPETSLERLVRTPIHSCTRDRGFLRRTEDVAYHGRRCCSSLAAAYRDGWLTSGSPGTTCMLARRFAETREPVPIIREDRLPRAGGRLRRQ